MADGRDPDPQTTLCIVKVDRTAWGVRAPRISLGAALAGKKFDIEEFFDDDLVSETEREIYLLDSCAGAAARGTAIRPATILDPRIGPRPVGGMGMSGCRAAFEYP